MTQAQPRKKQLFNMNVDLMHGPILSSLLLFMLPILVSNLFQQLYNTVDTMIVGNVLGDTALAAIGSCGSIYELLVGFGIGIGNGLAIVAARSYGAQDEDLLKRTVTGSVVIGLIASLVITAAGFLGLRPLLQLLDTPAEILEDAYSYIIVIDLGVVVMFLYNLCAGLLRAIGNSVMPLVFLLISSVLNVGLDLLFVLKFGMGVEGVAYATIIAQAVSAILTMIVLVRYDGSVKLSLRKLRIHWDMLKKIVSVGIPAALQMAVTAFSNVFVQGYINYFGADCMSGWTAYTKVDQLVILPVQSISMANTTFVGQNLGVGDTPRAKKGVRISLWLSVAVTAVLLIPVLLFAPDLTAFFNSKAEVVSYGALLLRLLSPFYFFFCINQIYSAALRGAGNSQVPMWIMLGSFVVFRQIYLYIVANYVSNEIIPIALSYPAGWFVCSVATLIYYRFCKFDSHRLVEDV